MGAEVEFLENWVRKSIIFGGVKSHAGVEGRIGVRHAIKSIGHQMNQFLSKFQFFSLLSISEHRTQKRHSSCVFFN